MRIAAAVLTTLLVTSLSPALFAQDADAENDAGFKAFAAGDFVEAAEHFATAYRADPDPLFRKNEAVAWFKAKRCESAIEAANAFLHASQGTISADTDEAASVIANCKVDIAVKAMNARGFDIAERLLSEADEAARDQYTSDRVSAARVEMTRLRKADADASEQARLDAMANDKAPERSSTGAVLTLAGGAAMVASAAVWHIVTLSSTVPRLEEAARGSDAQRHKTLSRRVDTARILVPTLYGLGIATTSLGVWFFIDQNETTPNDSAPEQSAATASFGVSWSGRF